MPTPVTQQSSPSLLPPELTPSAAPFRPSQSPQPTPLPPPPPPPLVREGSWLTGVPSVSDLPTVATLSSTDGGWEQAREAFHAAGGARGPDGRPDVGEGATRIAGEPQPSPAADALIMHGFSRGLPDYAQSLPPRAPPPLPFFSFDPWAATPEETPPSSTSTSPFPTSLSPLPPTRPQTYPPVQRAVHSPFPQDQRKTAPVPLHPTPNFHRDRRYDFPSAPSPPLYAHFSQPPSHAPLHSWAANSPAGPSQEGYHLFSDPGRHSSSPPGYGVPVPRVDVAVYRRSSNPGEGRRPPPSHAAQPRRRQQSFETGVAASGNHPTFARTSQSYGPPGAVPPPLADRQPFLSSRAQSAPTVQSSSSLPPPSSGAVKLRSGLPERSTWAMWVGSKSLSPGLLSRRDSS